MAMQRVMKSMRILEDIASTVVCSTCAGEDGPCLKRCGWDEIFQKGTEVLTIEAEVITIEAEGLGGRDGAMDVRRVSTVADQAQVSGVPSVSP